MSTGDWWVCWRCSRPFVHARLLARHLIDIHNEQPACPPSHLVRKKAA